MDERITQLIHKLVYETIRDNYEYLASEVAKKIDWADGWQKTVSQVSVNTVLVSTEMSVQIILSLLLQTGIFTISEEALRPKLTVVRGGADLHDPRKEPDEKP